MVSKLYWCILWQTSTISWKSYLSMNLYLFPYKVYKSDPKSENSNKTYSLGRLWANVFLPIACSAYVFWRSFELGSGPFWVFSSLIIAAPDWLWLIIAEMSSKLNCKLSQNDCKILAKQPRMTYHAISYQGPLGCQKRLHCLSWKRSNLSRFVRPRTSQTNLISQRSYGL